MPTPDETPPGAIHGGWTDGWSLPRLPGRATPEATAAFHRRFPEIPGRSRPFDGLTLSSVGLGTYLGREDDADDDLFHRAILRALALGANVLDSAVSYRAQRSERVIGRALRDAIAEGLVRRDEVFVSSKAGYVPFEGARPPDIDAFVDERYVATGIASRDEMVNGVHCMSPRFLADSIARSRRNLGLDTIDLYYLHNPESHLDGTSRQTFFTRLRPAFAALERAVAAGHIGAYGTATWHGYRKQPGQHVHHSLEQFLDEAQAAAREVGHADHHFRVVQLPYNLAMPEAFSTPTQERRNEEKMVTLIAAAAAAGVRVMCSAPLLQGQLTSRLPEHLRALLDEGAEGAGVTLDDPGRALQFARSTPGVLTALAGMKRVEHVEHNLAVLAVPALDEATIRRVYAEDAEG